MFAGPEEPLGHTHNMTYKIDTGVAAPIKQSPRRQPLAQDDYLECVIQELINEVKRKPLGKSSGISESAFVQNIGDSMKSPNLLAIH